MNDTRAPRGSVARDIWAEPVRSSTRTESICLPGRALTLTEMLQAFDVLRRRLARTTRGPEGAFAGFDYLDASKWDEDAESGFVLFTAQLVAEEGRTQVVQYAASKCDHLGGECRDLPARQCYLRGSGRTVGLPTSRASDEPARRFAIAAPQR